jgi:hypothetical protein
MEFLEQLDAGDLLIIFLTAGVAGFLFVYVDNYVLAKIETAVGIPAGTF